MCAYVCWAVVHACQRSADSGGGTTVVLGYSHPVMCRVVSGWKTTTAQILLGSEEEEYVFQVLFHMHLLANLLSKQFVCCGLEVLRSTFLMSQLKSSLSQTSAAT